MVNGDYCSRECHEHESRIFWKINVQAKVCAGNKRPSLHAQKSKWKTNSPTNNRSFTDWWVRFCCLAFSGLGQRNYSDCFNSRNGKKTTFFLFAVEFEILFPTHQTLGKSDKCYCNWKTEHVKLLFIDKYWLNFLLVQ